jgi:ER membrane protein complex subunit 1
MSLLLLLPSLLLLIRPSLALYEDQAGTFDWYRPFFGRITSASFLPATSTSTSANTKPRLIVAAPANGVVGAVDASPLPPPSAAAAATPEPPIAWRRAHPASDAFAGAYALAARPPVAVVASAGGRVLRAWDAADGPFRWEAVLPRTPLERAGGDGADAANDDDRALAASAALAHSVAVADAPGAADGSSEPSGSPSVVLVARAAAASGGAVLQVQAREAARGELLWRAALPGIGQKEASGGGPIPPLPRVLVSADASSGTATVAWWYDGSREVSAVAFKLGGRDTPAGMGSKPSAAGLKAAAGSGDEGAAAEAAAAAAAAPPAREPLGPVRVWKAPRALRASAPASLLGNALAVAADGGLVCATADVAATTGGGGGGGSASERATLACAAAPPPSGDGDGGNDNNAAVASLLPGSPSVPSFLVAYSQGGVAIFAAARGGNSAPTLVKAFSDATAVSAAVDVAAVASGATPRPRHLAAVVAPPAAAPPSIAAARRASLTRVVDAATGEVLASEKSALPPTLAGTHARWHTPGADGAARPPVPRLAALSFPPAAAGPASKPSDVHVATVWSDHALTLAAGRLVAWLRDEALGTLSDAAFFDLPTAEQQRHATASSPSSSSSSTSSSSPPPHPDAALHALGYSDRLRAWLRLQYVSALVQVSVATPSERQEQRALRGALSDRALPHRDANGMRKLVVGVSESAGKVVALHNGDGHVVWEHRLAPVGGEEEEEQGGGGVGGGSTPTTTTTTKARLVTWRTFHDTKHAPQVAVVRLVAGGARAADGRARARVDVLDAHTGRAVEARSEGGEEWVLPAGTEPRLVALPLTARDDQAAEQRVFLLLAIPANGEEQGEGKDDEAAPLPKVVALLGGPPADAALRARSGRPPRFWLLRGEHTSAPTLEGYEARAAAGDADAPAAATTKHPPLLRRLWRLELPGRVLAAAARPPGQPLHSAVKVLGDRTLRVKHTDPNTLVAVCEAAGNGGGGGVEAVVVDAARGAVLHRALHPSGLGPASAVASEHWVAYAFEDASRMRHQLAVAEFYSRAPVPLSLVATVSGAAARALAASGGGGGEVEGGGAAAAAAGGADAPPSPSSSSSTSFQQPPRPSVLAQSFYFQRPITGLAVTATTSGITPQQLLVSTSDGRVAAVDRRFLDARRPLLTGGRKATAAELEEGLVPYQDTLPMWGAMHATYDRAVAHLQAVAVAPADLESVCLMLARGSDLFATRLAPAKHFDALEPDFAYGLLAVALAALAVGAAVARYSSRRAVVKAKWM